jgi:hypothetical protein
MRCDSVQNVSNCEAEVCGFVVHSAIPACVSLGLIPFRLYHCLLRLELLPPLRQRL